MMKTVSILSALLLFAPSAALNLRGISRVLSHTPHLPNDECSGAIPIRLHQGVGTVSGTSVGSHDENLDLVPHICGTFTERGVWYQVTIRGRKQVTFSTCNQASFDTKISIFEDPSGVCSAGNAEGSLQCIAGQDDNAAAGCRGFTTELGTNTMSTTTFYVLVHGFFGETGDFTLTVSVDNATGPPVDNAPRGSCTSENNSYCREQVQLLSNPSASTNDCRTFLCEENGNGREGSCDNRCGQDGAVYGVETFCYCDDQCQIFGDCCSDVQDYCPHVLDQEELP